MELATSTIHTNFLIRSCDKVEAFSSPYQKFGQKMQFENGKRNFERMEELDVTKFRPDLRKLVNKLGGTYCSGKPLSLPIRRRIVAMAEMGLKACDISRQLQISHGCVSKIIAKWRATGSIEPRPIGGSKPKKTIANVIAAVRMYKRTCPSVRSIEIRRRLLEDGICKESNVPSLSSINRIIRMQLRDDVAEFEAAAVHNLMLILSTATEDSSKNDNLKRPQVKLEHVPATNGSKTFQSTRLSNHSFQRNPKPEAKNQYLITNQSIYSKAQSPPQSQFTQVPDFCDQVGMSTAKIRSNRSVSTASTSSSISSISSDGSIDWPWSDHATKIVHDADIPHNSVTTGAINFDNDDFWSLLDELPLF